MDLSNIGLLGKPRDWLMVRSGQIKEQNQRYVETHKFLGTFAKLREATISFLIFYIQGSVHRNSLLIRDNIMQQYAGIYLLQKITLHVSGVHRTHHQDYIKL